MEFNSQICTTEEQSKRLLSLGLKAETADMRYKIHYFDLDGISLECIHTLEPDPPLNNDRFIPAWSLHRLMEIGNFVNVGFLNIDKMYECCIRMIEGQIRGCVIDKKYLEE